MAILCSGSIAVDHIMVYEGRFQDVIHPEALHVLSVAFHVPRLRRSFGGTAANIAFNLRLLGEAPLLVGTVGDDDFDAYSDWLDRHGLARTHILPVAGQATAGAYIITDQGGNQIIGFHAGAMDHAHKARVTGVTAREQVEFAVISANGKRAMLEHARALKAEGVHTVIDPGQGLPLFDGEELLELLGGAHCYVVNDFEWSLTRERTGLGDRELTQRAAAVIVTHGEEGATLWQGGTSRRIAPVKAQRVVDPTGCGDAHRAGLLCGLAKGAPFEHAARMGGLMGAFMVEQHGTQSLSITQGEFAERFRAVYGEEPAL